MQCEYIINDNTVQPKFALQDESSRRLRFKTPTSFFESEKIMDSFAQ